MAHIIPNIETILEEITKSVLLLYFFSRNMPHIISSMPREISIGADGDVGADNNSNNVLNKAKHPKIMYTWPIFIIIIFFYCIIVNMYNFMIYILLHIE
jgi:hypothetical protein